MTRFPLIPDKHYFTIGEVSEWCGVERHVLRYWEKEFARLRPVRRTNRRCYTRENLSLLIRIYTLLRVDKYTMEGAKQVLADREAAAEKGVHTELVREIRGELEQILNVLK